MRNDFNRSFNRTHNFILFFFGLVFALIIAMWATFGYLAVTVAKHPEIIGESAGKILNGFENQRLKKDN